MKDFSEEKLPIFFKNNQELYSLYKEQLSIKDKFDFNEINIDSVKTIAGIDVAYFKRDDIEYGVCCIDVFDIHTFEIIEKETYISTVNFPYIPGYLSYRELPLIIGAYEKLKKMPDIFMLDGNGYLHPNHMGIATMFSLATNQKSIGVAKTFYNFAKINFVLGNNFLDTVPIIIDNQLYGYVMRSRENCKPIFISPGNNLGFQNCIDIVKICLNNESRIPIPTRTADLDTHLERKKLLVR